MKNEDSATMKHFLAAIIAEVEIELTKNKVATKKTLQKELKKIAAGIYTKLGRAGFCWEDTMKFNELNKVFWKDA